MADPHDTSCAGTREALLEAALICFAEKGFEGASIRMIADRACRHTSLIAHHFGNKEGLYLAVFKRMLAEQAMRPWEEPLVTAEDMTGDAARATNLLHRIILHVFMGMHAKYRSQDATQSASFRLWMEALRMPVPGLEELMKERVRPLRLQVAACIQVLRPDLPEDEIPFWCSLVYGQCVMNTMMRGFNELVFGPGPLHNSPELMAERVADVTLRAIGRT